MVVQRVERVEELFLRRVLVREELDVVNQQDVDVAVHRLEARTFVITNRVDEVVSELFRVDVANTDAAVQIACIVSDGVQ